MHSSITFQCRGAIDTTTWLSVAQHVSTCPTRASDILDLEARARVESHPHAWRRQRALLLISGSYSNSSEPAQAPLVNEPPLTMTTALQKSVRSILARSLVKQPGRNVPQYHLIRYKVLCDLV